MILDILTSKNNSPSTQEKKKDSWSKSIYKSISWRILGTLDTMIIAFFLTGELQLAISIGGIELFTKMILYVIHERIWEKI